MKSWFNRCFYFRYFGIHVDFYYTWEIIARECLKGFFQIFFKKTYIAITIKTIKEMLTLNISRSY